MERGPRRKMRVAERRGCRTLMDRLLPRSSISSPLFPFFSRSALNPSRLEKLRGITHSPRSHPTHIILTRTPAHVLLLTLHIIYSYQRYTSIAFFKTVYTYLFSIPLYNDFLLFGARFGLPQMKLIFTLIYNVILYMFCT